MASPMTAMQVRSTRCGWTPRRFRASRARTCPGFRKRSTMDPATQRPRFRKRKTLAFDTTPWNYQEIQASRCSVAWLCVCYRASPWKWPGSKLEDRYRLKVPAHGWMSTSTGSASATAPVQQSPLTGTTLQPRKSQESKHFLIIAAAFGSFVASNVALHF